MNSENLTKSTYGKSSGNKYLNNWLLIILILAIIIVICGHFETSFIYFAIVLEMAALIMYAVSVMMYLTPEEKIEDEKRKAENVKIRRHCG